MPKALAEYWEKKRANPKQSMSEIANKYGIPETTFWKRVTDRVAGTGYQSGGARKPRVLTKGTYKYFTCTNFT